MSWEVMNYAALDAIEYATDRLSEQGFKPVVVTDPPYNIGYGYRSYRDKMPEDEYWGQLRDILGQVEGGVLVMYPEAIDRLSIELGEAPVRRLSWVYPSNTARQHRDAAFYGVKPDFSRVRQPYRNQNDKRIKALMERTGGAKSYDWVECNQVKNTSKEKTAHPCQMPLKVMELIVGILPDGVGVIDPFCGSGTTLVACQKLGVPCVGIDIDPAYCKIASGRLRETNAKEQ